MTSFKTEDMVRDEAAKILGFDSIEDGVKQGVGQITTFKQLGIISSNKKPDGWYLPQYTTEVAIILETKNSNENLNKYISGLEDYISIVREKYQKVVGILYNGSYSLIYIDSDRTNGITFVDCPKELQHKSFYISLFDNKRIDKGKIYNLTKRINDNLHFNFAVKNLYHRMIFTACALVAERYDAKLADIKNRGYAFFHGAIRSTLAKSFSNAISQNQKVNLLLEVYDEIKMNITENQESINDFIDCVIEISNSINSKFWNGEDVMGIFFNEFNRYKKKSDHGQVFTPDHITSLMYRILNVDQDDKILDATCGSGAFLVKSMCNMIQEARGVNTKKAKKIKQEQLFGIEFDREIFALACANMLIHKDGKTNLENLDARSATAKSWIESKGITKVLMNPPFENKYGCIDIVKNVLDSVNKDVLCAFILPDKKLEKVRKAKKILEKHRLLKIIKLPENLFSEGLSTSIFVFNAKTPQKSHPIFSCYIEEDGLQTVKNQGRQDIRDEWIIRENYWVDVITKTSGDKTIKWLNPQENLSYFFEQEPLSIDENDFAKTLMERLIFDNKLDIKELSERVAKNVLYESVIDFESKEIKIKVSKNDN
ncbi:class I SAM-dependent DNA methyltransferase [Bartonella sp. MR30HLJHH]|uniref:HsdM family class I SAM-dependent methyltransferase n=1 Tax=Bartonella sp. MR30HLJHH TaxID=3243557 RepID=UPI0035CF1E7C